MRDVHTLTQGQVVAIDGKKARRSGDKAGGTSMLHVVSAWASDNQLALGQVKIADDSNEITAIPKLLVHPGANYWAVKSSEAVQCMSI